MKIGLEEPVGGCLSLTVVVHGPEGTGASPRQGNGPDID